MQKVTLSKKVSELLNISRNQAEEIIKRKKISLNNNIEYRPYLKIDERDIVEIADPKQKKIKILIFHKPKGCITSRKDEQNRPTIFNFIPKKFHQFHYIGRLDFNSEGLLILTDNVGFKRFMELPKSKIIRKYLVNVQGTVDQNKIKSLNHKIYGSITYQKPIVKIVHTNKSKHVLSFEMSEGKNREIRNICKIFNLRVEKLRRISFCKFILKSIPYGGYREMEINENY